MKPQSVDFFDASAELSVAYSFVQAIFMAALDLGDPDSTEAIQTVANAAQDKIKLVQLHLSGARINGGAA